MAHTDTLTLLARARAGDTVALDEVIARYRPRLARWARGRLPIWARTLADTDDLVQNTLIKTVRNLEGLQLACEASFQCYLREGVKNAIRDEVRNASRRPAIGELDEQAASGAPTPLDRVLGTERLARYEEALARLTEDERAAVVARFEFGLTHRELAAALGKATPDAARKHVERAMARLLEFMQQPDPVRSLP